MNDNIQRQLNAYDRLGGTHKLFPTYPEYFLQKIRKHIRVSEGDFLDFGCGQGAWGNMLAKNCSRVVGLDLSIENLAAGKEAIEHMHFVRGDALRLPFRDCSFDFVFSGYTLHHLPDQRKALDEVFRVLRPRGTFYCLEPSGWNMLSRFRISGTKLFLRFFGHAWLLKHHPLGLGFITEDERLLSPRKTRLMVKDAGFSEVSYITCSALPSIFVNRHPYLSKFDRLLEKFLLGASFITSARK